MLRIHKVFFPQLNLPNISDYNSSTSLSGSPSGVFMQRGSRSEADLQTSSPHVSESNYLSPRVNNAYGQTRYASRFHAARNSPAMMLSPAAYSPYPQSQFCPSPATFSDTPLASPLQSEFHDSEGFTYFGTPQMVSHHSETIHSVYASPAMLHHSPDHASADYYGHSSLVSPPITPMEAHAPYSVKIELDDRSYEYPMSPYTPTHPSYLHPLPQTYDDSSRRPVSAGRLMPQREMYHHGMNGLHPLKRAASLNSSRYAKSLSPPRSSPSPPGSKRPTYSKWTAEEDEMLRTAISIHGTSKWSLVAAMVKGRTAMQCSTRWQGALNTTIHKGKWEIEEDRILIAAVEKWRVEHPPRSPSFEDSDDEDDQAETIPWGLIAAMLPRRRTGIQCQARWSEALDPTVRKGKWTLEEDEMLYKGVAEHGQCWIKVASKVHGRTQRQIRTRWMQIRGRDK